MGLEAAATLTIQRRRAAGKALLESDHILFRGEERVRIPFAGLTNLRAEAGVLKFENAGEAVTLELGAAAGKWARRILHPPSRLDKLGVKPGLRISLSGEFDADFRKDLSGAHPRPVKDSDIIFAQAEARSDLRAIGGLARYLKPAGALWVVYPKGIQAIRESDVFTALRAAGLTDTKVASFSATHTALKFVIPVAARASRGSA